MARGKKSIAARIGIPIVGALLLATAASAEFSPGDYTHNQSPCTTQSRVDPVNIVFYDWGTQGRAENTIETHAGWTDTSGSTQYFYANGSCYVMSSQRASGGSTDSRFHIRLHPIYYDNYWGWTTIGDAHHEDFVWYCPGHAVDANGPSGSGFDQGRNTLADAHYYGGHNTYTYWWGNTQNFQQCDGDYAGSDGYTEFIQSHQAFH